MSSGRWQVMTICIFGSVRNSTRGSVALSLSQNSSSLSTPLRVGKRHDDVRVIGILSGRFRQLGVVLPIPAVKHLEGAALGRLVKEPGRADQQNVDREFVGDNFLAHLSHGLPSAFAQVVELEVGS